MDKNYKVFDVPSFVGDPRAVLRKVRRWGQRVRYDGGDLSYDFCTALDELDLELDYDDLSKTDFKNELDEAVDNYLVELVQEECTYVPPEKMPYRYARWVPGSIDLGKGLLYLARGTTYVQIGGGRTKKFNITKGGIRIVVRAATVKAALAIATQVFRKEFGMTRKQVAIHRG